MDTNIKNWNQIDCGRKKEEPDLHGCKLTYKSVYLISNFPKQTNFWD